MAAFFDTEAEEGKSSKYLLESSEDDDGSDMDGFINDEVETVQMESSEIDRKYEEICKNKEQMVKFLKNASNRKIRELNITLAYSNINDIFE